MASDDFGIYTYLSWARSGIAAGITPEASSTAAIHARAGIELTVEGQSSDPSRTATVNVRLYGPAEVVGIDEKQVVRVEPPPGSTSLLPNNFPFVEFARADFPWMFTPQAASQNETRLKPWLCLVVVPNRNGITLMQQPDQPLPVLVIQGAAHRELPNLDEIWAWAHVQMTGSISNAADRQEIRQHPERIISRILCPRKLQPQTAYYACLVPVFDVGRKTGLGEQLTQEDTNTLKLAWDVTQEFASIRLPVYHHYEFTTGRAGDFESLVKALEPRQNLPADIGMRPLDVSRAGVALPDLESFQPALSSAFIPTGHSRPDLPETYKDTYTTLLEQPERILTPPLYGRWQADQPELAQAPGWMQELNLDLRLRAAAAYGVLYVQQEQENLMASAWDQLDDIDEANRLVRRLQMARAVGNRLYEQGFGNLPDSAYWLVTHPVTRRIRVTSDGATKTLRGHMQGTLLDTGVLSPTFRRLARPRGTTMRRLGSQGHEPESFIATINEQRARRTPAPDGAAVMDNSTALQFLTPVQEEAPLYECTAHGALLADTLASALADGDFEEVLNASENCERDDDAVGAGESLRKQAERIQNRFKIPPHDVRDEAPDLVDLRNRVHTALAPDTTVAELAQARIRNRPGQNPLETIIVAPEFPQPMQNALRDLSQDLILANLDDIEPESIVTMEPDSPFIESFMVGLNHEMSRELLWRGYPTDLQGTYFKRFWDRRINLQQEGAPANPDMLPEDIEPIHLWQSSLGGHLKKGGNLVLVIRGELMRRYPNATIYLTRAEWLQDNDPAADVEKLPPRRPTSFVTGRTFTRSKDERFPLFSGTLEPDITYFMFDITPEQAHGEVYQENGNRKRKAGWYVVIQSPPTDPAFGFNGVVGDERKIAPTDITDWNDVNWRDVEGKTGLDTYSFVEIQNNRLNDASVIATSGSTQATWGESAANIALVTLQRPTRVVIHADDLIPQ
jgi:hypothetical protein